MYVVRWNMRVLFKNMVCGEDNNYIEENEVVRDDLIVEFL